MMIPLGMIRATQRDDYGRTVDILINPLQVVVITDHCGSTIVYLSNGKHLEVRESSETLEKAWTNIMKHTVDTTTSIIRAADALERITDMLEGEEGDDEEEKGGAK